MPPQKRNVIDDADEANETGYKAPPSSPIHNTCTDEADDRFKNIHKKFKDDEDPDGDASGPGTSGSSGAAGGSSSNAAKKAKSSNSSTNGTTTTATTSMFFIHLILRRFTTLLFLLFDSTFLHHILLLSLPYTNVCLIAASILNARAAEFVPSKFNKWSMLVERAILAGSADWHKHEGKIPCGFSEHAKFHQGGYTVKI